MLRLALKGPGRIHDLAVFLDYASLPQNDEHGPEYDPQPGQPRSPQDHAAFKRGLLNVNLWYSHQLTCIWLLKWVPERVPNKYMDYMDYTGRLFYPPCISLRASLGPARALGVSYSFRTLWMSVDIRWTPVGSPLDTRCTLDTCWTPAGYPLLLIVFQTLSG